MTIKRFIDGREIEIELSSREMADAYFAVRHENYREDCEDIIDWASDEEVEECYGVSREQFELLLDDMAERMQKYMDDYGNGWAEARDEAIADTIRDWRKENA